MDRKGAEGRTLAGSIEKGQHRPIAGRARAENGDRILPRVSTASGGVKPGVNLNETAALQELEDLDRREPTITK